MKSIGATHRGCTARGRDLFIGPPAQVVAMGVVVRILLALSECCGRWTFPALTVAVLLSSLLGALTFWATRAFAMRALACLAMRWKALRRAD